VTVEPRAEVAVHLADLARDVADQADPASMIDRVAQLAAKVINCSAADIIRVDRRGQLRISASSDPNLSGRTAQAWQRWPHAPEEPTHSIEMVLQRSSYMQQLRAGTGIVQELIAPLRAGSTNHGFLRFLFARPRGATADRALISAFCIHAAIALDQAALLTQVDNLRVALNSSRQIGAAVGVLMARGNLTYPQAAEQLKTASMNYNRKLSDIADDVLLTGQLSSDYPDALPARSVHRPLLPEALHQ
jgi:GAF domain-containing protein